MYFSPSLMCMDYLHIEEQIKILNQHMDFLHYDVMDGHFCKNMALSSDMLRAVKKVSELPIDVHMMVEHPDEYVDVFCDSGADYISLQAETINTFAFRNIDQVKARNVKFGIVLNPATPLSFIQEYIGEVDMLTIMTVDVGFAGQKFNYKMLEKIRAARRLKEENGYKYMIQIDGAVNEKTYRLLWEAGAECLVIGNSALFSKDPDLSESCRIVKEAFAEAVAADETEAAEV